ncbi:DUF5682 family protein [Frankia sp. QA3]|uniref:DUF5682 family protein n=1 Tax=Frankia sp. QA3 TaxID=710111 RepID=UPI000269C8A6|nr:DUF5682 family protein [Frankia sp. QA3]EIV94602.1 VWA domain containing CoxE-like protein [Frankia sp. QA3]
MARQAQGRREELREAHLRLEIRAASAEAARRVAVICGAWHVPTLTGRTGRTTVAADRELLRGGRPVRTATTWVPWTHALLSADSSYGAGVTSPGWYHHLWAAPDEVGARWVARVAALLRAADLPASTASVVETVRLAEALAIDRAVGYGASLVRRPADTVLILISDLIEGGDQSSLIARLQGLVESGVTVLLALSDDGAPAYDHRLAATCAQLGAPAFACTPDGFSELLAAALRREEVGRWAALHGLVPA